MRTLKATLLILILVLLSPVLRAQDCERWILLTDPHIPPSESRGLNGRNVVANFRNMVKEVLATSPLPDGVIITGDLANHKGVEPDYLQLKLLLSPLKEAKIPLYPLLGNHDRRDPFLSVFPEYKESSAVSGRVCYEVKTKYVDFYLLDSNEAENSNGVLGQNQLAWLEQKISKSSDRPAVLFAHHDISSIAEKERLQKLVTEHRRVKAFVFGHTHVARLGIPKKGRPFYNVNILPISCGPDHLTPYGWNECVINAEEMVITIRTGEPEQKINGTVWRIPLK